MNRRLRSEAFAALAAGALAVGVPVASASLDGGHGHRGHGHGHGHHAGNPTKHVLLISVDGLHQSDLNWYVARHPGSELARLVGGGADYTSAHTPVPSD